jgi:quinol monooxygenase YgiN
MKSLPFTLATYRVKPGKEDDFLECWRGLAETFSSLENPPFWGTLIRSKTTPSLFHSFGPWEKAADVEAMRSNPDAGAAFQTIHELCDEMTPDDCEVVIHVRVRKGGDV